MQRFYLFSNFCLGLTLALLTTQPVKAESSVRIIGVSQPTVRDIAAKPLKAQTLSHKSQTKSDRVLEIVKRNKVAGARKAKEAGVESKYRIYTGKSKQLTAQVKQKPQQIAQATPDSNTNTPLPKLEQQLQQRSLEQSDLPKRSTPVPSPNPLRLPTEPEEVQLLEARPISSQQALELALRNSLELQGAQLTIERSDAALREVQAAKYPTLGISTSIDNSGSYIFSDKPTSLSQQDNNSTGLSGGLELKHDLFTSGRRSATIKQAQERLRSVRLDFERISEELRLDVSTAYYDLQQADEDVRIQQTAVTHAQAILRDAQLLAEAGLGTRFDVLTSQVEVGKANQNLANALSQQRIARSELATQIGLPETIFTAAEPVEIAGVWNLSEEQSIDQAYKNRPELQQLSAERNIQQQQRRIALSALGPQIDLSATYKTQLSLSGNDNSNSQQNQDFTDGYSFVAKVSMNLFDGGAARARARQAEADIAITETNFVKQRNQIRLEVKRASSQLQSNFENIKTATAALNQAQEALGLARERFKARVGTQTEVIDAENRLTQAESNRVNAILNYNRFMAQLQRAISSI